MNDAAQRTNTQLNGWKEIAEFFGKSPRTVQRWEAELGLPVRRIKTPAGEIVFALRDELSAWRDGRTETPLDLAEDADAEPRVSDVSPIPADTGAQRRDRAARWAAVLLMLIAVSAVFWYRVAYRRSAATTQVATAEFRGSTIVARDLAGNEIWTYQFEQALWTRTRDGSAPHDPVLTPGDPPLVADVDRDGRPEVLAIATFGDSARAPAPQVLLCLSSSGTPLWTYRPDLTYTFRSRTAGPSNWNFLDILVAEGTAEPGVWVSLAESPWWPSVVVRIDANGHPDVRLVNSGAIYSIEQAVGPKGWRLLAGGINNEYNAASLAVIGEGGPAVVSPQSEGDPHQCLDCPTGRPLLFLLFPRTDVNIQEGYQPYNRVWDIRKTGADVDIVTVESANYSAFCFYTLTPALDLARLALSDSTAHQVLESAGKLAHKEADCPLRRMGASVRKWTPDGGWITLTVPVVPR